MSRKRVRWWVALLLPGLVLRSLIPLGFMPMFGPGQGMEFVLCAGYAPVPGTMASMSMDMSMDAPMEGASGATTGTPDHLRQDVASPVEGGGSDHQDHGTCPYGASPALGGLPALGIVLVTAVPAAELAAAVPQVAYFKVSPRAQSSRGPPA